MDRLYTHPPAGTDEILFPARYGDGPAAETRDPGRPDPPWELSTERELGAAELEWLFTAPGDEVRLGIAPDEAVATRLAG